MCKKLFTAQNKDDPSFYNSRFLCENQVSADFRHEKNKLPLGFVPAPSDDHK